MSDDGSYDYFRLLLMFLNIYGAWRLFLDLCAAVKTTRARWSNKATPTPLEPPASQDNTSAGSPSTRQILYSADGLKNGIYNVPGKCGKLRCATPSKITQHNMCEECARNSAKGRTHANG